MLVVLVLVLVLLVVLVEVEVMLVSGHVLQRPGHSDRIVARI